MYMGEAPTAQGDVLAIAMQLHSVLVEMNACTDQYLAWQSYDDDGQPRPYMAVRIALLGTLARALGSEVDAGHVLDYFRKHGPLH